MTVKTFLNAKVLSTVVALITIASAVIAADHYLAKSSDLYATNLRLDYKINKDLQKDTINEIYDIELQYGMDPDKMPALIQKRYFYLKVILDEIEKTLEQIRQTQIKKGS